MTTLTIPTRDGTSFEAYVAFPDTKPAPVVVVIQEIFGVNQVMQEKSDWLAQQGFVAVCPDLFWRIEPGVKLTDKTEEEWARAFELFNAFDVDKGIDDLRAVQHTMRGHADCNGKVGAMGYCLGGKLAYLLASRGKSDATVGYYGVGIAGLLDEAHNIKKSLMLHIAEEDEFVSKDEQKQMIEALGDNQQITLHSYAGENHAFSRPGGKHYNKEAADLADTRTLDFLRTHLG